MQLFRRHPRTPAWVGIAPADGWARVACISTGPRPHVQWVERTLWVDPVAGMGRLRQLRELGHCRLVCVLEPGRYDLLRMDAPELPRTEWRDATRWLLADRVDYAVDDAALDVLSVRGDGTAQPGQSALLAVSAPRENVQSLVRHAQRAGMRLDAVDVGETALRNIASLMDERPQALLHVSEDCSLLVITAGGELLLSRQLGLSLAQLGDAADGGGEPQRQALEQLALELQRTLDGFERNFAQVRLERLLVAPGAQLRELIALAGQLLQLPLQVLDVAELFDLSQTPALAGDAALQAEYLPALGAALRDQGSAMAPTQHLNLLDEHIAPPPPRIGPAQALALAAALFMLVFLLGATLDAAAAHREQLTEARRAALAAIGQRMPQQAPALAELEQLEQRHRALQAALRQFEPDAGTSPRGHADLLLALARQTPDEQQALWLTGLRLRAQGRELTLQGQVLDAAALPAWLHRLEQEPLLQGRSFEQLELTRLEDGRSSRFTLASSTAANAAASRAAP